MCYCGVFCCRGGRSMSLENMSNFRASKNKSNDANLISYSRLFYPYIKDNIGIKNNSDFIFFNNKKGWFFNSLDFPIKHGSMYNAFVFMEQDFSFGFKTNLINDIYKNNYYYTRQLLTISVYDYHNNEYIKLDSLYVDFKDIFFADLYALLVDNSLFDLFDVYNQLTVRVESCNCYYYDIDYEYFFESDLEKVDVFFVQVLVYSAPDEIFSLENNELNILKQGFTSANNISETFNETEFSLVEQNLTDNQKKSLMFDQAAGIFSMQHPVVTAEYFDILLGYGFSECGRKYENEIQDNKYQSEINRLFNLDIAYLGYNYLFDLESFKPNNDSAQKLRDPTRIVGFDYNGDYLEHFGENGIVFDPYSFSNNYNLFFPEEHFEEKELSFYQDIDFDCSVKKDLFFMNNFIKNDNDTDFILLVDLSIDNFVVLNNIKNYLNFIVNAFLEKNEELDIERYRFSIVSYGSLEEENITLDSDWNSDPAVLANLISSLSIKEGSEAIEAFAFADSQLFSNARSDADKVIALFSDGTMNASVCLNDNSWNPTKFCLAYENFEIDEGVSDYINLIKKNWKICGFCTNHSEPDLKRNLKNLCSCVPWSEEICNGNFIFPQPSLAYPDFQNRWYYDIYNNSPSNVLHHGNIEILSVGIITKYFISKTKVEIVLKNNDNIILHGKENQKSFSIRIDNLINNDEGVIDVIFHIINQYNELFSYTQEIVYKDYSYVNNFTYKQISESLFLYFDSNVINNYLKGNLDLFWSLSEGNWAKINNISIDSNNVHSNLNFGIWDVLKDIPANNLNKNKNNNINIKVLNNKNNTEFFYSVSYILYNSEGEIFLL